MLYPGAMAGCGCSGYAKNPLSHGCSDKSRSKNIARLIREGYDPKQAAAIAYSTQRKHGCKVPRKMKKNPPYSVYGAREEFLAEYPDLPGAIEVAERAAKDRGRYDFDKSVVYDAGRRDRGPKGEFIAMFRPNKRKSKGAKSAMYRSNRAGRFDAAGIREDANVALAEVIEKKGMPAAMKIVRRVFGTSAPLAGSETIDDLKALRSAAEAEIGHMVPNRKRSRKGKRKYKANVSNPMMPLLLAGAALGAIAYFLFAAKQPGSEEDAFKTGGGSLGPGGSRSSVGPFIPR